MSIEKQRSIVRPPLHKSLLVRAGIGSIVVATGFLAHKVFENTEVCSSFDATETTEEMHALDIAEDFDELGDGTRLVGKLLSLKTDKKPIVFKILDDSPHGSVTIMDSPKAKRRFVIDPNSKEARFGFDFGGGKIHEGGMEFTARVETIGHTTCALSRDEAIEFLSSLSLQENTHASHSIGYRVKSIRGLSFGQGLQQRGQLSVHMTPEIDTKTIIKVSARPSEP